MMIFLFGGKKSVKEMLIKVVAETKCPSFVKNEIESALMGVDTELKGDDLKKFEAAYKSYDKSKDSLVRVLETFIMLKRAQGAYLGSLASITERLRLSQHL
jgi:hypothetical protein